MKRKPIPKAMRQLVYEKYNGHCAYCGKKINMDEMQVDHAIPIAGLWYGRDRKKVADMIEDGSINNIENLMPACRPCNYYKGVGDIEQFRYRIKNELDHTCRGTFQARLAIQFGIITYHKWDGKFYFEKGNTNPVLHLMVNNTCTNNCPLCCNKQYNVDDIPVVTVEELRTIDTICFTGGQPLFNLGGFSMLCDCIERNYPNIRTGYVYMNGAELFSMQNIDTRKTQKRFEHFPCNTNVCYGLTMSPKCKKDWDAIREFKPYMGVWKSNRIYCFSDNDVANAEAIFGVGEIEIVRREWQKDFVPAPNTIFRRLPIWL